MHCTLSFCKKMWSWIHSYNIEKKSIKNRFFIHFYIHPFIQIKNIFSSFIHSHDVEKKEASFIHTFTYDFIHPYISHRIHSHLKFHALFMYSHVNSIHAFLKKKVSNRPSAFIHASS